MIAVAQKTYSLLYRGKREKISAGALAALNDSMGARYAGATPDMQRKIIATILELNFHYLKKAPTTFANPMDEADWFQIFKLLLPHALMAYDPLRGHLHAHLIGWKLAAMTKWQNEKDTICIPQNQRNKRRDIARRIEKKKPVSEVEKRLYESMLIKMHSLNQRFGPDSEELQDLIAGDDLRETAGKPTERELWKKVEESLSPKDFQIWKWRHHSEHELSNREIGERLGVTPQRVDQITNAIRLKLRARLALYFGRPTTKGNKAK
jgi:RNA polymerase sigma factor (sigma-70 family)